MPPDEKNHLEGSGAIAQSDGVAIGGDAHQPVIVTGDDNVVNVTYRGMQIVIPSPDAVARHRTALRERLEADACARWGGMSFYIQEEGATLPIEASP